MSALPNLHTDMGFAEASAAVVDHLERVLPMGFWAVTRYDGERQVYLEVRGDAYGLGPGDSQPWEDTFCVRMLAGLAPQIAPDAMAVPAFASNPVAAEIDIGAYVGIPITRASGELFGTLCGIDPHRHGEELAAQAPLLQLLAQLLGAILEADLLRTRSAREIERAHRAAETDAMTELLNRRGWDRVIALEEDRLRRFGDPGAVVVIDLDGLKERNDRDGHLAGDAYIVSAAEALRGTVRADDAVARIGGDEFAVMVRGLLPPACEQLVERIRAAFTEVGVEASLGLGQYTIGGGFATAFTDADTAMYADKRTRRPRTA